MMLRLFPALITTLPMRAIGVGLGMLITTSYRSPFHTAVDAPQWLHEHPQHNTPDVERPEVWTKRAAAWRHRPFGLQTHA